MDIFELRLFHSCRVTRCPPVREETEYPHGKGEKDEGKEQGPKNLYKEKKNENNRKLYT